MLMDSPLWRADISEGVNLLPQLNILENKTVLITGASGLICSTIVDMLLAYNESHLAPIGILLAGRSQEKMRARFGTFLDKKYVNFIPFDAVLWNNSLKQQADYIIHGASNASPGMIMQQPVETMSANFVGLQKLLELARTSNTKRVLYISSSEVYGRKETVGAFSEDEYGFIDILNPRNSYSVGKRAAETLCVSFGAEYGVESVIVRPGHIYGPTASTFDNRVSSAFAYQAVRGENIVLKSDGTQLRSYCYCIDCATAILKVLLCGENQNAYNISNPDSIITIRQMAEYLAKAGGVQLIMENASDDEKRAFNPMANSSLKSSKLESLGWRGLFNAETGLMHTVRILEELNVQHKC